MKKRQPYELVEISDADWNKYNIKLPDKARVELIEAVSLYKATLHDGSKVISQSACKVLINASTLVTQLQEELLSLSQDKTFWRAVQSGLNGQLPISWDEVSRFERGLVSVGSPLLKLSKALEIARERVIRSNDHKVRNGNLTNLISTFAIIIKRYKGKDAAETISKGYTQNRPTRLLIDYLCRLANPDLKDSRIDTAIAHWRKVQRYTDGPLTERAAREGWELALDMTFTRETLPKILDRIEKIKI